MKTTLSDMVSRLEPYERELLLLAEAFRACPEPGYEERRTVLLWREFAADHGLRCDFSLDGRAPLITLGDYAHAETRIVVTADLDAVGMETGSGTVWRHLCGHYTQSVHALGLALLWQSGVFAADVAIRLVGSPAEECLPAYVADYPLPFIAGKRRLLDVRAFDRAQAVLATHLADNLPARAIQLISGARGAVWLKLDKNGTRDLESFLKDLRKRLGDWAAGVKTAKVRGEVDIWVETRQIGSAYPPSATYLAEALAIEDGWPCTLVAEYQPLLQDPRLLALAGELLMRAQPPVTVVDLPLLAGASDLGDVSRFYPTLQVFVGGTAGFTHDPQFRVVDDWFAHVWPVAFLAQLIERLRN